MPWLRLALVTWLAGCGGPRPSTTSAPVELRPVADNQLRTVRDFDGITDRGARSRALFVEIGRVLTHPRCINCHPTGDSPHQRSLEPHDPPVVRGPDDNGVVGMECTSCHQDRNQPHTRVPGAPKWHVAPLAMGWVGKTLGQICEQIKDPKRNGGKSMDELVHHMAEDSLVGWGWTPGAGREPAPGTQKEFGELIKAWADAGSACPKS